LLFKSPFSQHADVAVVAGTINYDKSNNMTFLGPVMYDLFVGVSRGPRQLGRQLVFFRPLNFEVWIVWMLLPAMVGICYAFHLRTGERRSATTTAIGEGIWQSFRIFSGQGSEIRRLSRGSFL